MRDLFEIIGALVLAVAGLIAVVILSAMGYQEVVDRPACAEYGRVSHQQTMYTLGTACLVQRNGEWVDYKVAVGFKQEVTVKSK